MSVNLSAREISDSAIRESVSLSLLETGFEPTHLILEITESALLRDLEATIRNLESLKSLGLSIAVDDFGTGFSSFSHLEQLPIDILKVDRSFVANINVDGRPAQPRAGDRPTGAHPGTHRDRRGRRVPDQVTPLRDIAVHARPGLSPGHAARRGRDGGPAPRPRVLRCTLAGTYATCVTP
jgi:hypothetical protein